MLGWRLDSFGDLPSPLQDFTASGRCCWLRTAARVSQCVFLNSSLLLASPFLPPSWWPIVLFPKSFWLFDFQVQGKILLPGLQVVEWLVVGPEESSAQQDVSGGEVCHHQVKPVMAGVRLYRPVFPVPRGRLHVREWSGKDAFFFLWDFGGVRYHSINWPVLCALPSRLFLPPDVYEGLTRSHPRVLWPLPWPYCWESIEIDLNLMSHDWHKMLIIQLPLNFLKTLVDGKETKNTFVYSERLKNK